MYEVGDGFPLDSVESGSTLLLTGPPMTGKRRFGLQLLAEGFDHGDAAAVISTDTSSRDVRQSLADAYGSPIDQFPVGVVDAVSETRGQAETGPLDRQLNSPADLTGIGMEFTELIEQLYTNHSKRIRVGLFSLTTMSMYVSTEQVIRFLHVFVNRISEAESVGFVVAHSDTMDEEHLQQIRSFVDGAVEFRETDDGSIELRVVGLGGQQTEWIPSREMGGVAAPETQRSVIQPDDIDVPSSLQEVLDSVQTDAATLTICNYDGAEETLTDLERYFDRHNVTVRRATMDVETPRSIAMLHHGDDLLGAESVSALRTAIEIESGEIDLPGDRHTPGLLTKLDQSVFGASAASKRLLIDVSHHIEIQAYRNGGGRLHAGFQRFSRLADDERTARIYRRLSAAGTDVHVYGIPDADIEYDDVTTHGSDRPELAESWFVVYDGNGNPDQQAALLAFERDGSGEFDGFWTYDSEIATQLDQYLTQTYGVGVSSGTDATADYSNN